MTKQFSISDYKKIIEIMANQTLVRKSVFNSYENNPWWPNTVQDWRIKMIIAGLSTRVGFRVLPAYQKVISNFTKYSFEEIKNMPDENLLNIIKPLGLSANRLLFIRSMIDFIENNKINIETIEEDKLVSLIHKNVKGASYKVGACCVLYAKNYTCGVIPIDSGIKNTLTPCIGLATKNTAEGHETARYQFEEIANQTDWKEIAEKTGYSELTISDDLQLWWFHLVTINFKRHFCNNKKPEKCPLRQDKSINCKMGCMCSKETPKQGGDSFILLDCPSYIFNSITQELKKYGFQISYKQITSVEQIQKLTTHNTKREIINSNVINAECSIDDIINATNNQNGRIIFIENNHSSLSLSNKEIQTIIHSSTLDTIKEILKPKSSVQKTHPTKGVRILKKY